MAYRQKHAVESTVIGEYNDSGYLKLDYKGKTCAFIRMDFLQSDFPQWEFDAEWLPPDMRGLHEPVFSEPKDHGLLLKTMLSRPNLCCRNWIARQYDHEVQGGSVIKPLVGKGRDIPSDAVVLRPILDSTRGIAVSQALEPFYSEIDTYHMTAVTIDEAVRRVLCVGGRPGPSGRRGQLLLAHYPLPSGSEPRRQIQGGTAGEINWALRDYCLAYRIPLLSGKDSMYVDGMLEGPFGERRKVSGLPTLLFTVSSVVRDIRVCITMDAKCAGDLVYVLGETGNELGGRRVLPAHGKIGAPRA
jgi:phosphoribosylformylglycinamidine synthase subunit PurSL